MSAGLAPSRALRRTVPGPHLLLVASDVPWLPEAFLYITFPLCACLCDQISPLYGGYWVRAHPDDLILTWFRPYLQIRSHSEISWVRTSTYEFWGRQFNPYSILVFHTHIAGSLFRLGGQARENQHGVCAAPSGPPLTSAHWEPIRTTSPHHSQRKIFIWVPQFPLLES